VEEDVEPLRLVDRPSDLGLLADFRREVPQVGRLDAAGGRRVQQARVR
jgi:hypothetical protein